MYCGVALGLVSRFRYGLFNGSAFLISRRGTTRRSAREVVVVPEMVELSAAEQCVHTPLLSLARKGVPLINCAEIRLVLVHF